MRARTAGVHHAFRNTFAVEVGQLVVEMEVLQQRGPARPGFERVLVVRNFDALGGGHPEALARGAELVELFQLGVHGIRGFHGAGGRGFGIGARGAGSGFGSIRS